MTQTLDQLMQSYTKAAVYGEDLEVIGKRMVDAAETDRELSRAYHKIRIAEDDITYRKVTESMLTESDSPRRNLLMFYHDAMVHKDKGFAQKIRRAIIAESSISSLISHALPAAQVYEDILFEDDIFSASVRKADSWLKRGYLFLCVVGEGDRKIIKKLMNSVLKQKYQ